MKRFLNILFVNILILIFLLVLIEIITRIFLNFYIGNSTAGLKERQANLIYQPFVMYGINWDKKIEDINKINSNYKILIIGGSTAELFPDKIIKEDFLEKLKLDTAVYNLAFGGYVSRQQMISLILHIDKIKPDLVISIDGANDIIHSLRQETHGNFLLNETYSILLTKPYFGPFIWLLQNSQFYNSLVRYFDRKKIYNFKDKKLFLENYVNTLSKIKLIAESYGSQFIHVLQPHIEFKNLKSPKEKLFTHYDYRKNFVIESYNFISKRLINTNYNNKCNFIDGRLLFQDFDERIFSDDVHFYNNDGYKIILDKIIKCIN